MTTPETQLCKTPVDLLPEGIESGVRWTLGPTWYTNHAEDEIPFLPYYDHPSWNPGQDIDNPDVVLAAQQWAQRALRETTDYLISGWRSLTTPILVLRKHQLEIHTTDGCRNRVTVSGSVARQSVLGLTNSDNALIFSGDERGPENALITTETIIPVRNITIVKHTTEQVKIPT